MREQKSTNTCSAIVWKCLSWKRPDTDCRVLDSCQQLAAVCWICSITYCAPGQTLGRESDSKRFILFEPSADFSLIHANVCQQGYCNYSFQGQ